MPSTEMERLRRKSLKISGSMKDLEPLSHCAMYAQFVMASHLYTLATS